MMKRALQILIGLAFLIGIVVLFLAPVNQTIFGLAIRSVEYTFVVIDGETGAPVPGATIDIWKDPEHPGGRKHIAQTVADESGTVKYVNENQSVEDVIGIRASRKLDGILRHPAGVGTFVDRYWCMLDITANAYVPLMYQSLGDYFYDDNGYDREAKVHRIEVRIKLHRK